MEANLKELTKYLSERYFIAARDVYKFNQGIDGEIEKYVNGLDLSSQIECISEDMLEEFGFTLEGNKRLNENIKLVVIAERTLEEHKRESWK